MPMNTGDTGMPGFDFRRYDDPRRLVQAFQVKLGS